MKTAQSSGPRPDHQTVTGTLASRGDGKAIAIGFTEQQLSRHAGDALFWGWLQPLKIAPAFMHGLLCDARKLTHGSYLRRDPLVPELLGITRVAGQSVLSRFYQGFTSAGDNLRCFRPLWPCPWFETNDSAVP